MVCLLHLQLCKQVSAEGGFIQRSVRAVPESNRDLWAGKPSVCLLQILPLTRSTAFAKSLEFLSVSVNRLDPTPWTTPCWNTAPKNTSSKLPCATSSWTSSMQRSALHQVIKHAHIRRTAADNMHAFFSVVARYWKVWRDVFQPSQIQENASFWRFVMIKFAAYKTHIVIGGGLDFSR